MTVATVAWTLSLLTFLFQLFDGWFLEKFWQWGFLLLSLHNVWYLLLILDLWWIFKWIVGIVYHWLVLFALYWHVLKALFDFSAFRYNPLLQLGLFKAHVAQNCSFVNYLRFRGVLKRLVAAEASDKKIFIIGSKISETNWAKLNSINKFMISRIIIISSTLQTKMLEKPNQIIVRILMTTVHPHIQIPIFFIIHVTHSNFIISLLECFC